jgi:hypothetical protein
MPRIFIGDLCVNTVNDNSGLFYGQNIQCNWQSSEKVNGGFGEVSGEGNTVQGDLLIIGDQDIVDTFINNFKPRQT